MPDNSAIAPSSAAATLPAPDPDMTDWERSQSCFAECTEEQLRDIKRLRESIYVAFTYSDLGLTRKPKK